VGFSHDLREELWIQSFLAKIRGIIFPLLVILRINQHRLDKVGAKTQNHRPFLLQVRLAINQNVALIIEGLFGESGVDPSLQESFSERHGMPAGGGQRPVGECHIDTIMATEAMKNLAGKVRQAALHLGVKDAFIQVSWDHFGDQRPGDQVVVVCFGKRREYIGSLQVESAAHSRGFPEREATVNSINRQRLK
jgi:hypothetical protein